LGDYPEGRDLAQVRLIVVAHVSNFQTGTANSVAMRPLLEHLRARGVEVRVVPSRRPSLWRRVTMALLYLIMRRSIVIGLSVDSAVKNAIVSEIWSALHDGRRVVVLFNRLHMAQWVTESTIRSFRENGCIFWLRAENVENSILRQMGYRFARDAERLERFEREVAQSVDHVWAVTSEDADWFRPFAKAVSVQSIGMNCCITRRRREGKLTVGFLGNFRWLPNVHALRNVSQVAEAVRAKVPGMTFEIAGRGMPAEIRRALPGNCVYLGYVDDVEEFWERVSILLVPFEWSAGVKVKVLEAMAHGVCVLGTSSAFAGVPGSSGSDYVAVPDGPNVIGRCVDVLLEFWNRPELADAIGDHACRTISDECNSDSVYREMIGLLGTIGRQQRASFGGRDVGGHEGWKQ